jgi:hypothetical protein
MNAETILNDLISSINAESLGETIRFMKNKKYFSKLYIETIGVNLKEGALQSILSNAYDDRHIDDFDFSKDEMLDLVLKVTGKKLDDLSIWLLLVNHSNPKKVSESISPKRLKKWLEHYGSYLDFVDTSENPDEILELIGDESKDYFEHLRELTTFELHSLIRKSKKKKEMCKIIIKAKAETITHDDIWSFVVLNHPQNLFEITNCLIENSGRSLDPVSLSLIISHLQDEETKKSILDLNSSIITN